MSTDFDPVHLRVRAEATAVHWRNIANNSGDSSDKVKAAKAEGLLKQIEHLLELAAKVHHPKDPAARVVARNRDLVLGLMAANEKRGIQLLPARASARR